MRHTYALAMSFVAIIGLQLAGCSKSPTYHKVEPFSKQKEDGITKVTFTEKAMERAAVKTAPLQEGKIDGKENAEPRPFVPYSALMYVPTGETFIYTSPKPRTFVRQPVNIDYIAKNVVVLKDGPPRGTEIVTVGAAEIYGAEVGNGGGGGH
jgi:hypothetical protein